MIASLQDYLCDLLSKITGGDAASSNSIIIDSCSCDSDDKIFKTSRTNRAERSRHLNTLNLTGPVWNTLRSLAQVAQRILRWTEVSESEPRKMRASHKK